MCGFSIFILYPHSFLVQNFWKALMGGLLQSVIYIPVCSWGREEGEGRYIILISTVRLERCPLPCTPSHTHTHTHIFLAVRWDGKEFSFKFSTVKELLDNKPVIGEESGTSGDTLSLDYMSPLNQHLPTLSIPTSSNLTLSIPTLSTVTKWKLTKWELTLWQLIKYTAKQLVDLTLWMWSASMMRK